MFPATSASRALQNCPVRPNWRRSRPPRLDSTRGKSSRTNAGAPYVRTLQTLLNTLSAPTAPACFYPRCVYCRHRCIYLFPASKVCCLRRSKSLDHTRINTFSCLVLWPTNRQMFCVTEINCGLVDSQGNVTKQTQWPRTNSVVQPLGSSLLPSGQFAKSSNLQLQPQIQWGSNSWHTQGAKPGGSTTLWVHSHKTTVVATEPSSLAKHHKSGSVTSGYTLGCVCAESLENTNCC